MDSRPAAAQSMQPFWQPSLVLVLSRTATVLVLVIENIPGKVLKLDLE